jgi:hypothetical protein
MRRLAVLGLLLCASYEWDAKAKKREPPPTRSEAFAGCNTTAAPGNFHECRRLLQHGETAFLEGRWHPNDGPFGDCQYTKEPRITYAGGPAYAPGKWYADQCAYLSNIHNDAEFQKLIQDEKEAARQAEARRQAEMEKKRAEQQRKLALWRAGQVAALEHTLSQAAEAVPKSANELRAALVEGENPHEDAKRLLAEARRGVRSNEGWIEEEQEEELFARIRALDERNDLVARQFARQETKRLSKLTKARLRQYSPPRLVAQANICSAVDAIASEGGITSAKEEAIECLAMCEELRPRAEEIYSLLVYLCIEHPEQQRLLAEEKRRKTQIDRESGTRDLAWDRALATQKIALREERAAAIRRLKQLGAPYSKSKCATLR